MHPSRRCILLHLACWEMMHSPYLTKTALPMVFKDIFCLSIQVHAARRRSIQMLVRKINFIRELLYGVSTRINTNARGYWVLKMFPNIQVSPFFKDILKVEFSAIKMIYNNPHFSNISRYREYMESIWINLSLSISGEFKTCTFWQPVTVMTAHYHHCWHHWNHLGTSWRH